MNEFFKACIEDLWTTDAAQGQRFLHQVLPDGREEFCCLGLICKKYIEMIGPLTVSVEDLKRPFADPEQPVTSGYKMVRYDGHVAGLPKSVQAALGIMSGLGRYQTKTGYCALAYLNDSGRSFKEIARVMESTSPTEWIDERETLGPHLVPDSFAGLPHEVQATPWSGASPEQEGNDDA